MKSKKRGCERGKETGVNAMTWEKKVREEYERHKRLEKTRGQRMRAEMREGKGRR